MHNLLIGFRLLLAMTVICGGFYPLLITGIAQVSLPDKANGSIIYNQKGEAVGSLLIAQRFREAKYFWPRPSAGEYATLPSAASNKGPASAELKKVVDERRTALSETAGTNPIPADLLFASGSGLDPHISKAAARLQVERISAARKFTNAQKASLYALIDQITEGPQWRIWGEERVNVLMLNVALDKQ